MFRNLSPSGLGLSGSDSEIIELTLSHGFRGIDLDLGPFLQHVQAGGLAKARRLIDSARLKLGSVPLPITLGGTASDYQAQLETFKTTAALLGQMGCTRAAVCIEPASDLEPFHANFETHRKRLQEVGKLLAMHQMSLAVGFEAANELRAGRTFEFIHDLEQLVMLLGIVGLDNVGLLVDPWDMTVAGNKLDALSKLPAAKLIACVLSDLPADVEPANAKASDRRLPGESGKVDSVAVLTRLAELGFTGPVSLAADRAAYGNLSRDAFAKLARERFDQAWKGAGLSPAGKLSAEVSR